MVTTESYWRTRDGAVSEAVARWPQGVIMADELTGKAFAWSGGNVVGIIEPDQEDHRFRWRLAILQ